MPLRLNMAAPVATVDERYLSFALDTAQVDGGKWWDAAGSIHGGRGTQPAVPFDFHAPRLKALARALAPATLRIGGTEADLAYYDLSERGAPLPPGFESRLTRERYDAAFAFAREQGFDVVFDLNAGPGVRTRDKSWDPSNAAELMRHASESDQWPAAWELGNEVNAYWFVHGLGQQVSAHQYARDFARARELLRQFRPTSLLAGPASAYWPILGEPFSLLFGEMSGFLQSAPRGLVDIVTWHFYPTESQRCGLAVRSAQAASLASPRTLNEVRRWAQQVKELRDLYQPQAQLWLGETGPAQCGGEPGASDRYASGLWWLDELGTLALLGHQKVIRQTLAGSDYGMIEEGSWEPRPDYWNSLLWKRLMGRRVLAFQGFEGTGTLRAYAHCAASGAAVPRGAASVLLINLDPLHAQRVRLDALAGKRWHEYAVSAPSLGSRTLSLNGKVLRAGPSGELPQLAGVEHAPAVNLEIEVPPSSYTFAVIADAALPACL